MKDNMNILYLLICSLLSTKLLPKDNIILKSRDHDSKQASSLDDDVRDERDLKEWGPGLNYKPISTQKRLYLFWR